MYEDNVDDIKNKGYACVSHVWGDQKKYSVDELGIKNGINWEIPLSHHKKLQMVKKAMLYFKREYCWWDILCMPQDKQNEINLEIPLMGDYYNGADVTLVLSNEKDKLIYTPIDVYITNKINMRPKVGYFWTYSAINLMNIFKDEWFKRVWTFQEAILSKNMIYVSPNNIYFNLSKAFDVLINKRIEKPLHIVHWDNTSNIVELGEGIKTYKEDRMDLMSALSKSMKRNCKNPQDQFYGIIGILGYKTFPVDYNMDKYTLSIEIAKYAYSKGDISWLAVHKNPTTGFIQLADVPFGHIGTNWKEDSPGTCNIDIKGKILETMACSVGIVAQSVHWSKDECKDTIVDFALVHFKEWDLDINTTKKAIMVDRQIPNDIFESFMYLSKHGYTHEIPSGRFWEITKNRARLNDFMKLEHILNKEEHMSSKQSIVIIQHHKTNRQQPVIVSGHVDVGDEAMLLKMHDKYNRVLGIIIDKNYKRKGIFLHTKNNIKEGLIYDSCKFPL